MLPILHAEGHEAFPTLALLPEASAYDCPWGLERVDGRRDGTRLYGVVTRIMVVESSEFVDLSGMMHVICCCSAYRRSLCCPRVGIRYPVSHLFIGEKEI